MKVNCTVTNCIHCKNGGCDRDEIIIGDGCDDDYAHCLIYDEVVELPHPKVLEKGDLKTFEGNQPSMDYDSELWDADPDCKHEVISAPGGGVKCTKCKGWYCL